MIFHCYLICYLPTRFENSAVSSMVFKKNIGKNDTEKTCIQQFTVISNSSVYHSVPNWTLVNSFVYDKEKTRLHMLWTC